MKNIPKKKGRWLSALLAGCLLLSIVPATAFAAEDTTEGKGVTAEAAQTPGQEGDTKGGTPDLEEDTADTENTKNAEDPASDPTTEKKDATVEDSKTSGQPNTVEDSKTSGQPNTVEDSKTSGQPDAAEQSTAENASPAQGTDTDAAGGNGSVEVRTTVRNNYTDTRKNVTITYPNGIALVDGDQSALNGSVLTFTGLGDLTIQAAYDSASNQTTLTLDISKIPRKSEEQTYYTEYKENKSKMTTTYDGSKLSYTDSITDPVTDPVTDPKTGKVTIHEIRDDYYTRNHVYERACLTIPAEKYTVTYTDGRGGMWFADEVHEGLESGTQTPKYNNGVDPTREGYDFMGWSPAVTDTVTENVTYTAQWESKSEMLVKELLSDIKVECVNDSSHTHKEYDTSVGGFSAVTLETERDKFTSTITVDAKRYVKRYNDDTGKTHQLVTGEAETRTIVVEFDSSYSKDSVTVKSGKLPVIFRVACAQQPAQSYTVTYTDGVDGEEIFKDQSYTVESGKATPAFSGTPTRKGYTFAGWKPSVAASVTGNATYEATWKSDPAVATPNDNKSDTSETTSPKNGDTGNGKNSATLAENKSDTVTAPKTGDARNLVLWIALLFFSCGVLVGAVVIFKKQKYNR